MSIVLSVLMFAQKTVLLKSKCEGLDCVFMMICSMNFDMTVDILVLLKRQVVRLSSLLSLKRMIGILTMVLLVKIRRSQELHQLLMQFLFRNLYESSMKKN